MISRVLLLFLFAASCAAAQPIPIDTLRAPAEADSITVFGWTVDADADRLLVGARVWPPPYPQAGERGAAAVNSADHHGTAFVYRRQTDGSWVVEGRLRADYISNEDCFGWSMDLRGDLAVLGAECEGAQTSGGWYSGAVYVFRYDGETWVRDGKLVFSFAEDEVFSVYGFGASVSLGNGYLVAGARTSRNPANPDEDYDSGAVYVFERESGLWLLTATLTNDDSDVQINEGFGMTVAAAENRILIGAPQEDVAGVDRSGAVYIFERGEEDWVQRAELADPSLEAFSYFGSMLTLSEDGGVVGSWAATHLRPIEYAGGIWEVGPPLELGDAPVAVARHGNRVLSTVWGTQEASESSLFEKTEADWEPYSFSTPPFEATRDELVSLTGRYAFVGIPILDSGQVLIYDLGPATSSEPSTPKKPALALTVAPNPMSSRATAHFELPTSGDVRLTVYDVLGREVMRLAEGARPAGEHVVELATRGLAPGVYVLQAQTEREAVTQPFTVVR